MHFTKRVPQVNQGNNQVTLSFSGVIYHICKHFSVLNGSGNIVPEAFLDLTFSVVIFDKKTI